MTASDILESRQAFERVYGQQKQAIAQWKALAEQVEAANLVIQESQAVKDLIALQEKANMMGEAAQGMQASVDATWGAYVAHKSPGKGPLALVEPTEEVAE